MDLSKNETCQPTKEAGLQLQHGRNQAFDESAAEIFLCIQHGLG